MVKLATLRILATYSVQQLLLCVWWWCGGQGMQRGGGWERATEAHPLQRVLLHNVEELAQVERLPLLRRVRAGQHGGEVLDGGGQVAGVARLLAQHVVQVLLDEGPLPALVHAQHLPAYGGGAELRATPQRAEGTAACVSE